MAAPAQAAAVAPGVVTAAKPKVTANLPTYTMVTAGKTATLRVKAKGSSLKYQWYQSKAASSSWAKVPGKAARKSSLKVKASFAKGAMRFRVKVTNAKGSAYSKATTLIVRSTIAKPLVKGQVGATAHWAVSVASAPLPVSAGTTYLVAGIAVGNHKSSARNPKGDLTLAFRAKNGAIYRDQNASGGFRGLGLGGIRQVGALSHKGIGVAYAIVVVPSSLATGGRWVVKDSSAPSITQYFRQ